MFSFHCFFSLFLSPRHYARIFGSCLSIWNEGGEFWNEGGEFGNEASASTLILPWCRDGNYGCLFDGTSNLSLTGKVAHFELGYIPKSAKELKAAVGFLITNHARKHIMALPSALRKRNIIEEVGPPVNRMITRVSAPAIGCRG
jgi:hypothetical protein